MRPSYLTWAWIVTIVCVACGSPPPTEIPDTGGADAGPPIDGGGRDAGPPIDGSSIDTGVGDAFVPSSVLVAAAAGGIVRSDDGLFEIYVMPGALAADTTITITTVAASDVPADIAATSPLSRVYAVEPDGLTFTGEGAYAHYLFPTWPASVVTPGALPAYASVSASARPAAGGTITAQPRVRARYDVDLGRLDVVARLAHFSYQWAFAGRTDMRVDFGPTTRGVGAPFTIAGLLVDAPDPIAPDWLSWSTTNASVVMGVGDIPESGNTISYVGDGEILADERAMLAVFGLADVPAPDTFDAIAPSLPDPFVGSAIPWGPDLPTFQCVAPGDAAVFVDLDFRFPGRTDDLFMRAVQTIHCTSGAEPSGQIFVGDTERVTQSGGVLVASTALGAAANFLRETTELASHCSILDGTSRLCSNVTDYTSDPGPGAIAIHTDTETITGTFDAATQHYDVTGLAPPVATSRGFLADVTDAPDVDHASIQAPDWLPSGSDFGAPAGLDTVLSIPDGSASHAVVTLLVSGGTGPGETSVTTVFPLDQLPLVGSTRTLSMASSSLQAALTAAGLTVTSVRIVVQNDLLDTSFFGAPVTIAAGHVVDIDASALAPPLPPGALDQEPCSVTDHTFAAYHDTSTGLDTLGLALCIDATSCTIANALICSPPSSAFYGEVGGTGAGWHANPPDWYMLWSTAGVANESTTPVLDTDDAMILERVSDGARFRVDYRPSATSIEVYSVAPSTGAVPVFGASEDCERQPITITTPYTTGTSAIYARLCIAQTFYRTTCSVFGDVEATPENETCPGGYAIAFGVDTTTGIPFASAPYGGGSSTWQIASATAGTVTTHAITGMPVGSDVGVDLVQGSMHWTIVVQWTGTELVVRSIAHA